jgi:Kazal-type serine protease inhibitor domain
MSRHRHTVVPVLLLLALACAGAAPLAAACTPAADTLCLLGGRFRVDVHFNNQYAAGAPGRGMAVPLEDKTGAFAFFDREGYDVIVKVVDGRGLNQHFWVFLGALTNIDFTVTVLDTETGTTRTYVNPAGHTFGLTDTDAFGPPPGPFCGGFAGVVCPLSELCDPDPASCETADGSGSCVRRPEVCAALDQPVCGCDGRTYANDCERQRTGAGVGRRHAGPCRVR